MNNSRLSKLVPLSVPENERPVSDFFKNHRMVFWIFSRFNNLILMSAPTCAHKANATTLGYADLIEPSGDTEIREELPASHVFTDLNALLVYLATFIEAYSANKSEGPLIKTGNIFYVKVDYDTFAVDVYWDIGGLGWNIRLRDLMDYRWRSGTRVFSATQGLELL